MKFSKWIITFIVSISGFATLLCLFNYIVDPFGAFGDKYLKWYSYDMVNNPRVAKIEYLDQYHERYDSYIIGGSKSSSLAPERLNDYYDDANFYSMLMYGGDYYDYEKTLYYLVENYEVKNIIVHNSLFEISGYQVESDDVKQMLHAKVSGDPLWKFYSRFLTLNPKYSFEKLEGYAKRAIDPFEFSQIKPEDGVYNKVKRDSEKIDDLEVFLQDNPSFEKPLGESSTGAIDQNVAAVKRMKEYCEERGITFTFITGATYAEELNRYNREELKQYWRKLAGVTDFWDFSGYNSVSKDPRHFYDPTHYRNSTGEMMLGYMFEDEKIYVPKDFGHYTTSENVNEHVENIFTKPIDMTVKEGQAKQVPILMYHHLVTDKSLENSMSISPEKFESDMSALKAAGYETVMLRDLIEYVHDPEKELPEKPVVVTFDDGYRSNYEYAYPILKGLDMKATIFAIGWSVGRTTHKDFDKPIIPHFSWSEAREMYNSGLIEIQNHTYDLHNPGDLPPYRKGVLLIENELSGEYSTMFVNDVMLNHNQIEENVGNQVFAFAYPYGLYTFLSEQILKEQGYEMTLSTKKGMNVFQKGDTKSLYAVKRINVDPDLQTEDLLNLLEEMWK